VTARARRLVVLAAVAALAACTAPRELSPPTADPARAAVLATLGEWSAQGRLAVRTDGGGGSGDLDWRQRGDEALIRVSGPLGAGALEIRWSPESLSVTGRDGAYTQSWREPAEAERFLAERLGWSFPAGSVRWWLLGVPDPAAPADWRSGPDGRANGFLQGGWSVSYERWADVQGLVLPVRLVVESPAARLRVLIDHWRIGPESRG
jgi:outer membrane lipoprotein LolB